MNEDRSLIALKAITTFINDIADEYGNDFRPILLYQRLINHTQFNHTKAINKHVEIFRDFSQVNSEAFKNQEKEKLQQDKIEYSEKVFVNIKELLNKADTETTPVIWQHLLTISAIVDPKSNAKEILKQNDNKEEKFVQNIVDSVPTDSNPMNMIGSLLSGGGLGDLLSPGADGNLDMSKMFGVVGKMLDGLEEQAGDDPQAKQMTSMLRGLTSNLTGQMKNGQQPDMGGILQNVMGAFAGIQNTPTPGDISDVSEEVVSEEKEIDELD